ncbi:hypothetical protein BKA93DRAFT_820850 [Sparassis latifolia]
MIAPTQNNTAIPQHNIAPSERLGGLLRVTFDKQPTVILEQDQLVESPVESDDHPSQHHVRPDSPSTPPSSPPPPPRPAPMELPPSPLIPSPPFVLRQPFRGPTIASPLYTTQGFPQPIPEDEIRFVPPLVGTTPSLPRLPCQKTSSLPRVEAHTNVPSTPPSSINATHRGVSDVNLSFLRRLPILFFLLVIWLAHLLVSAASCAFQVCLGLTLGHVVLHVAWPLNAAYAVDVGRTIAAGAVGGAVVAIPMSLIVFILGCVAHAQRQLLRQPDEEAATLNRSAKPHTTDLEADLAEEAETSGQLGLWRSLLVLVSYTLVGALAGPLGSSLLCGRMGGEILSGVHAMAAGALGMFLLSVSVICGMRVEGKRIGQDVRWGVRCYIFRGCR